MFFFYVILVIIFLLATFIIFTTIEIDVSNIRFTTNKANGKYLNKDYKIVVKLLLFKKFNYLKLDITKIKIDKIVIQKNVEKFKTKMFKDKNNFDLKSLKAIKNLKLKIEKINLNLDIGLEDAALLAISVGGISSIISIILGLTLKNSQKTYWVVNPIYQNRNLLNINLDCIFSLKLIHIIYTIYNLRGKGEKYGRTSNRRAYGNCNE